MRLEHGHEPATPADEAELQTRIIKRICGGVRSAITQAAFDQAIVDLGIVVTDEDVAKVRQSIKPLDANAESARIIAHTQLMISALTAVFDRGQDQHQVWLDTLKPKGITEAEWYSYRDQWQNPNQRATILRRLNETPDRIASQIASVDLKRTAIGRKLNEEVDRRISSDDPGLMSRSPAECTKYMESKRIQWWQARYSKIDVVLNDHQLSATCGLPTSNLR
jgi:hypothetical protein